ncbi:MAG: hypothetical protein IT300_18285 [Dehalococcoidia bacterium]|nr:hypothetical protein [Dehalococcoidia bacterium]
MRALLTFCVVILAQALVACDDDDTLPLPEPDRVVGIDLKCDFRWSTSEGFHVTTLSGWDVCAGKDYEGSLTSGFGNLRQELTVRNSSGGTYKVNYGAEHDVRFGDEWPPRQGSR